jgi:DNA-directed RNA polymerase specialized sigma24 family protein
MTNATRQALEKVAQILHEAGWDQPPEQPNGVPERELAQLRHAYEALLRPDHIEILDKMLGQGWTAEQAAKAMGLTAAEATTLLGEALSRLRDFVETYGARKPTAPEGQSADSSATTPGGS